MPQCTKPFQNSSEYPYEEKEDYLTTKRQVNKKESQFTKKDSTLTPRNNTYFEKQSPFSNLDSKYTKKENIFSIKRVFNQKSNNFSDLCLSFQAKIFQDNTPFVFQNGDQYRLNL